MRDNPQSWNPSENGYGAPSGGPDPAFGQTPPRRGGFPWWGWLLLVTLVLPATCCIGSVAFVGYIGIYGPDTGVYSSQTLPQRFRDTIEEVGALEDGEQIQYFYSDALVDIRDSFYFVSDRRVVIYYHDLDEPLTSVPFEDIVEIEFSPDKSFTVDSTITLYTRDDDVIWFPVSSDGDGDERFLEAIESAVEKAHLRQQAKEQAGPSPATADWLD